MKLRDTLLLVGAADSDRPFLRQVFQEEFNLLEASGIEQGLFLLEQNIDCIVTVIVDRPPPKDTADSFLYKARQRGLIGEIPVMVVITPTGTGQMEELAFSLGASDVMPRGSSPAIYRRRTQILADLFRNRQHLLTTMEHQAETIRHTNEVMVDALSSIIEYRSAESGSHILRIRRFTEILLKEVARSCPEYGLTLEIIQNISSAAALHDIGKVSIPDNILNKPGKLTEAEMAVMRAHAVNGSEMIKTLHGVTSEEYLRYAYNIARYHHERWNGEGYPEGLSGDDIPICAQVVGIADVFDALTNDRVYKKAIPPASAINMILNGDCGHFSPKLLTCFKYVVQPLMELAEEYATGHSPKEDHLPLPLPAPQNPDYEVSSLQMNRLKYQALLHYLKATVIEIDLNYGTFHIVYNPFPNFHPLPEAFPTKKELTAGDLEQVHPDDAALALREFHFLRSDFFTQGLRKHTFTYRILSSALGDFRQYQMTCIRLDTGNAGQHKAVLTWQPVSALPAPEEEAGYTHSLHARKASYILASNVICRRNDHDFTIVSGSNNLLDLLGYSSNEIETRFKNHFLELVLPEDRLTLRSHISRALSSSTLVESEYRVRHKDGRILWILEKGCAVTGSDNQEYFYGSLMDNTPSHTVQEELAAVMRRNQLIIDQSDDIIFDWDLIHDKVELSPNWRNTLGYDPAIILNSDMLPLSRIHPDDFPALSEMGKAIRMGQTRQEVELRIADIENRYLWFRLRLTPLTDAHGTVYRAVGTLSNVNAAKLSYLALQQQAQRDSLTGLLNKNSTHAAIQSYLAESTPAECALMMIDLDNFKAVNDRFGHLFGDTVLTRTAAAIRRLFRGNDVIGRVGGDEFMVLMKNTCQEQLARERCEQILAGLDELFHADGENCPVSCSIGVALSPAHGSSFQELFQRADQALYFAKKNGKQTYSFYRDHLELSIQQFSTPIDSNDQPDLAQSGLVRAVFHRLAHSQDMERSIQEVLTLAGQRTNVSRVYIFENNEDNTTCSNTFEWCNEGISPEMENLQNLSYQIDLPGWVDNYDENGILFCSDISQLPPGPRAILEPQGVKSMLHCAIYENGVFRAYIGLDECSSYRVWTKEQVDILVFLSEVVASFLLKKRAQDRDNATTNNLLGILATQRIWMYVIDPGTYRILYCNDKTRALAPDLRIGDVCYRCLGGRDTPCPGCAMEKLCDTAYARSNFFSPAIRDTLRTEAVPIQWNNQDAVLITCWKKDAEDLNH